MEERINEMIGMIESGNIDGFLNSIDIMAASKAYIVIRDHISMHHIKAIKNSGIANYQKFQDIKLRAKQSWEYDHKMASMADVNRACMNVYTLVLRLMRAQNDDLTGELNKVKSAINRIEEKVGLSVTEWDNEPTIDNVDGGDIDDVNDVQGIKENI